MSVYEAIARRRDVRAEFTGEAPDDATLTRVLAAAHRAPSVGMSQPWDFVVVRDPATRARFAEHVATERAAYAAGLEGERAETFRGIRIEGIRESGLGVVVTHDPDRGGPHVLGRATIDDTGLYSTCLAVQNLWLAATAEGLGVGWVSFYREEHLRELLHIPPRVRPVAWLCVGRVSALHDVPDLERHGWRARRPLDEAIHHERYRSQTCRRAAPPPSPTTDSRPPSAARCRC
ncbi:5,6-dimethylbenzimidazole synthase [Nocardioides dokdonensis FR1436]|uniref:5,6-dimethylbenzimidazole synthase n=1 Tax=Nocardioides dokdonensis FR1436 TaxID=1300347 RepID=A0A1A9GPL3_9ACTN|nr:5,6-dimethylbenzimidazole synthase [Nocardioides dokdonensis]ANH40244.1 5,6-dimethylbenzimidazole synthase [Nocardioides dokdonensis FR1436]